MLESLSLFLGGSARERDWLLSKLKVHMYEDFFLFQNLAAFCVCTLGTKTSPSSEPLPLPLDSLDDESRPPSLIPSFFGHGQYQSALPPCLQKPACNQLPTVL